MLIVVSPVRKLGEKLDIVNSVGKNVVFFYAQPGHESTRRVEVVEVRDTETNPVSKRALRNRPNTKRSRYLIKGRDLDNVKPDGSSIYREFYHGCIQTARALD